MNWADKKKIVIFNHHCEGTSGVAEELIGYLSAYDFKQIVYVQFPFFFSTKKAIKVNIYQKVGKKIEKIEKLSLIRFYKPQALSYAKDFVYAIYFGICFARKADLFIGTTNLLALAGVFLRRLGVVKKVAYYIIDYTPQRYQNRLLNRLYYYLDRKAAYSADQVWPLHFRMIEGRAEDGKLDLSKINYQIVPFGNNSSKLDPDDYSHYDRKKLVYFGGVLKSKGAELFVPIVKSLVKKGLKDFQFEVIGGGDLDYLKAEIKKNKFEKFFNIYGRIESQEEIDKMLLGYGLAVAPYYPEDKNSFSYYCDPGKVKIYLGCGLPIVITDVPPIAKDLQKSGAGLIADYDADNIAEKIFEIITDEKIYLKYRRQAVKMGQDFSWDKTFSRTLKSFK